MKPKIVRISNSRLELRGLVCGIKNGIEPSGCGGRLVVDDSRTNQPWRYELYCSKCLTCDCNGWAKQSQLINATRDYFKATQT